MKKKLLVIGSVIVGLAVALFAWTGALASSGSTTLMAAGADATIGGYGTSRAASAR